MFRLVKKFYLIFVAAFLCLTGGVFYWYLQARSYLWIEKGHVEASFMSITSAEEGFLAKVFVQEGALVEQGALLFTIENASLNKQLQISQASIAELKKEELFYKNQSEKAMQNYLADLAVAPEQEIEQHLQKLQAAQLKISQTQEHIALLLKEQNRLEEKGKNVSVVSPCQAIVIEQNKKSGDPLQTEEKILSLLATDACWIEAEISEQKLHLLRIGQIADVYLTAYPKEKWEGTLSWISPTTLSKKRGETSQPNQEKIPIKIAIRKACPNIKPGLSAKVRLHL